MLPKGLTHRHQLMRNLQIRTVTARARGEAGIHLSLLELRVSPLQHPHCSSQVNVAAIADEEVTTTSGRTFAAAQQHEQGMLYEGHVQLGQLQRAAVAILSAVGASLK